MHLSKLIMGLCLFLSLRLAGQDAPGQTKTDDQRALKQSEERLIQKAREQAEIRTNQPPPIVEKKIFSLKRPKKTPPQFRPINPEVELDPATREARLQELYHKYITDLITPREYHIERAKILAETRR